MSKIELFLIIGAVVIPFIAILFVLPKRKKKEKPAPATTSYVKEEKPKVEASPAEVEVKEKQQPKEVKSFNFNEDDDFKSYLELRNKRLNAPKEKAESSFARTPIGEYVPARLRTKESVKEDKSVAEQIQELTPELKAMLLAGVLDKKDY